MGDGDLVGLGEGRDLAHLQQAAHDADVGLDDVGAAGREEAQELEAAVEAFARGERAGELRLDLAPGRDVLGAERLLVEEGVIRGEGVAELDRLPGLEDLACASKA